MVFEDNVSTLHDLLIRAGFETINELCPLEQVGERKNVIDCILIARLGNYEIIYAEVRSNQEGIAADLARAHLTPCLVITRMEGRHTLTIFDHDTSKVIHAHIPEEKIGMVKESFHIIGEMGHKQWDVNQQVRKHLRTIKDFL